MPKLKSGTIIPTNKEETAINAGIDSDPDTYEMSGTESKRLRPIGRPKADVTKERISIRLSPEVTEYFRATGKGWQSRIDETLRAYVASHK